MISMVLEWIEIDDFDDDFGDDVIPVLSDSEMNVTKEQIIMKRKKYQMHFLRLCIRNVYTSIRLVSILFTMESQSFAYPGSEFGSHTLKFFPFNHTMTLLM